MPTLEIQLSNVKTLNDFQMETILTIKTPLPDPDTIEAAVEDGLRMGEIDIEGVDPHVDYVEIGGEYADHLIAYVHVISDYQNAP